LIVTGVYFVIEVAKYMKLNHDVFPFLAFVVGAGIAAGLGYADGLVGVALFDAAKLGGFLGLAAVGANQVLKRLPDVPGAVEEREVQSGTGRLSGEGSFEYVRPWASPFHAPSDMPDRVLSQDREAAVRAALLEQARRDG
jgi:hypothetical protein